MARRPVNSLEIATESLGTHQRGKKERMRKEIGRRGGEKKEKTIESEKNPIKGRPPFPFRLC